MRVVVLSARPILPVAAWRATWRFELVSCEILHVFSHVRLALDLDLCVLDWFIQNECRSGLPFGFAVVELRDVEGVSLSCSHLCALCVSQT